MTSFFYCFRNKILVKTIYILKPKIKKTKKNVNRRYELIFTEQT